MPSDATTFFLSFLTVFLGLAWYLWHLERKVTALQARFDAESTSPKSDSGSRNT